ncbi:MAG: hypothetical protein ACLP8A_16090 [Methylovirgula sp.]
MSAQKTAKLQQRRFEDEELSRKRLLDQDLNEALEESFPASDPPQMTQPNVQTGAPHRTAAPRRRHLARKGG